MILPYLKQVLLLQNICSLRVELRKLDDDSHAQFSILTEFLHDTLIVKCARERRNLFFRIRLNNHFVCVLTPNDSSWRAYKITADVVTLYNKSKLKQNRNSWYLSMASQRYSFWLIQHQQTKSPPSRLSQLNHRSGLSPGRVSMARAAIVAGYVSWIHHMQLLQLRQNVVCCHGNDGCPSGDAGEGAAGAGNVQVTIGERLVRVLAVLKHAITQKQIGEFMWMVKSSCLAGVCRLVNCCGSWMVESESFSCWNSHSFRKEIPCEIMWMMEGGKWVILMQKHNHKGKNK